MASDVVKRLMARLQVGGYPDVKASFPEEIAPGVLASFTPATKELQIKKSHLGKGISVLDYLLAHEMSHREQARRSLPGRIVGGLQNLFLPWSNRPAEREANEAADFAAAVAANRARRGQGSLPLRYVLAGRLGTMGKK